MALVDEIGARLSSQSVGGTTSSASWMLQFRELLDTPDQAVAIIPSGGFPQEVNSDLDRPTFQILVRGTLNASTGLEAKMQGVIDALNIQAGTWNGRKYVDCRKQGDMVYLGRDQNGRPLYSQNFVAFRSRTT